MFLLQQSHVVTRTADPTDNDNNETITVGIDGTVGLVLNPYVDEVNELRDVTITNVADNQVLSYDSATSMWVNTSLPINDLGDVTITSPESDQVLTYDADNSRWVNADIPQGSRFRFSTTDETSDDVEITGYITDNDLDAGTFTTVRSANFSGTGGRLQFELARFMSQLGTFADFATRPNWDQPWSDITTGNTVVLGVNQEDDLFSFRAFRNSIYCCF